MRYETCPQNTHRINYVNTTRIPISAIHRWMLAGKDKRAERLAAAIKRHYSSYKDAAERHGFKEPTLTSHANGTRQFDLETGYAYAKAFKTDPVWLLGLSNVEGGPVVTEPQLPRPETLAALMATAMCVDTEDRAQQAELLNYANALHTALTMLAADAADEDDPGYLRAVHQQVARTAAAGRSRP